MSSSKKKFRFLEAFCDSSELVNQLNNDLNKNISNNIIDISLIHKCFIDDFSLYCKLKDHLRCPYCEIAQLTYVHQISTNCKYGYIRSNNVQDHPKVCPFYKEYHEKKKDIHKSKHILTNPNKISKESINNLIDRLKFNYKIKRHYTSTPKKRYTPNSKNSDINSKSKSSNGTSFHPRILMWEHEPNLISKKDDNDQVCVFYGWVKSIKRIYKVQPLYKKKKYGEKEIFEIRLNDGSYIYPSPSSIKRSNKNQGYIQQCQEKDNTVSKLIYNKYFICMCQVKFTPYQKHPYPDIIYKNGEPAMWPYYR